MFFAFFLFSYRDSNIVNPSAAYLQVRFFFMPINKKAYERYRLIDYMILNYAYPSLQKIKKAYEDQFQEEYKDRTFYKDIEDMKDFFGAPIERNPRKRGYHYTQRFSLQTAAPLTDQEVEMLALISNIKQFQNLEIFQNIRNTIDKIEKSVAFRSSPENDHANYIQFETAPYSKGSELLEFFLQAIKYRKVVSFDYQKHDGSPVKNYTLHPYLLKEHRNRWYVIAWAPKREQYRVFGLDRVVNEQEVMMHPEVFSRSHQFDLDKLTQHSFGIFINYEEPVQEVILSFAPERANYFKSQPFRRYKQSDILQDDQEAFRVKFDLMINRELIMEIARLGVGVQVLAPLSLREAVREYLREAWQQYEK